MSRVGNLLLCQCDPARSGGYYIVGQTSSCAVGVCICIYIYIYALTCVCIYIGESDRFMVVPLLTHHDTDFPQLGQGQLLQNIAQ